MSEWKVYFGSNYGGHGRYARAGKEISVNHEFFWGEECYQILSLYECREGLVIDFCKKIAPEQLRAFSERWRHRPCEYHHLPDEEMELMEAENPAKLMFDMEMSVDGKMFQGRERCSMTWNPVVDEETSHPDERDFLQHYGLNPDLGWSLVRGSFVWPEGKRPNQLGRLEMHFSEYPVSVAGTHFRLEGMGPQTVSFTHPLTKAEHSLRIESCTWEHMQTLGVPKFEKKFRYPQYYEMLQYTLSPELEEESYCIRCVTSKGDQPIAIVSKEHSNRSIGVSIIGGADGPTSVFIAGKFPQEKTEMHVAFSPLFFEPAKLEEWSITFRVRRKDDYRLILDI